MRKFLPTPDASDRRSAKSKQQGLSNIVKKKMFATPQNRDYRSPKRKDSQSQYFMLNEQVYNNDITLDESTSSPEASPASLFPMLESEREHQITAGSGLRCLQLSESLNRPLSLARMLLASSQWKMARHLTGYSLIWKMKATPSNRLLFQLAPSERGTGETEFGLLLTPSTVQIEPTEERAEKRKAYRASVGRQDCPGSLAEQIQRFSGLVPTARQSDYKGASKQTETKGRNVMTNSLMDAIENGTNPGSNGQLNPQWVEWLMGYPIGWTD